MRYLLVVILAATALSSAYAVYLVYFANPRIERELREDPTGERARKVMLITLPSGRTLPVNYLREGDTIYVGADGPWWRQLRGRGAPVEVLVRGETLTGTARAIQDNPQRRAAVFDRLRPSAPRFFGTLVQIDLEVSP